MNWWNQRRAESARRVAEARKALSVTVNERQEAKILRAESEVMAQDFKERAVSLREIRLRNHITPSLFPPHERPAP